MVYYFNLADEPNRAIGSSNVYMGKYDWFSAVTSQKCDSTAEDWMLKYYPTSATIDEKEDKLYDLLKIDAMFTISQKLRDLIEKIEPDIHLYIPIAIEYGHQKYPYYILKFGVSEDCYNLEQSDVEWQEIPTGGGDRLKIWSKKYNIPLVFEKGKIQGKHLWQNATGYDMKFMSDELHALCIKHDVDGIKFEKQLVN